MRAAHRHSALICCLIVAGHAVVADADPAVPVGYQVAEVAGGLDLPTTMAFFGPDDLFVLEKETGIVKRVHFTDSGFTTEELIDLDVSTSSERGLLGVVLAPDFAMTGHLFLYYTNADPLEHRIERYTWDGADLVDPSIVHTLPAEPGPNHDGGIILFGPDEKLYAVIGDLNRNELTQNFEDSGVVSETGAVLRMNADGSPAADNPFADVAGWERIYGYGIRNSFGMTFDPLTGSLWDTENGPGSYDEVNLVPPAYNSGWEDIMGPDSRDPQDVDDLFMQDGAVYVDPKFSWFDTVAPTSILFLNSCRWNAAVRHDALVGDNNFGNIYRFEPNPQRSAFVLTGGLADGVADDDSERTQAVWGSDFGVVTDLEIGPDGYLYVVSLSDGSIYRVRPDFPMGDIDRDGDIDAADRVALVDLLLGLSSDPLEIAQGDFDGNGLVDGDDVQCFVNAAAFTD